MVRDINNVISCKKDYLTYPIRESLIIIQQKEKEKKKKERQLNNPDFLAKQHIKEVEKERLHNLELAKLIVEYGFSYVGRKYKTSSTTIRRWCRKDNMPDTIKEITVWYNKNKFR